VAGVSTFLQAPLRDRRGRLSPLKAATFAFIVIVPTFAILWPFATDSEGGDPSILLTYTTGTWSSWFLLLSLTVTPARRIFGWARLIAVRRMLGVAAVVYALAHCVVFFWLIHFDAANFRMELVRPTIWIATAATVGLVVLALTSYDAAVARMGVWWTRLHNATYVLTAAALVHFLLSRGSTGGVPFVLASVFFWLMAWRVLDRFHRGARVGWLLALGLAVAAFEPAFEAVWLYLYRGRLPLRTLTGEFSLDYSFVAIGPATFEVLVLALAVPLLAATFAKPVWQRRRAMMTLPEPDKPLGAVRA
jgi:sulfoxide reductase heme-binding subunit YedZ